MRLSWLVIALLGANAVADPKPSAAPAPDLVFTWTSGEMSKDMSIETTTITVTGTKLHYARTYTGRRSGRPGTKPVEVDATVNDPKKVAAALAALDKIKMKAPRPLNETEQMSMRRGCILRGKVERCSHASGTKPDPVDLKAIAAVRDALLDAVQVPAI